MIKFVVQICFVPDDYQELSKFEVAVFIFLFDFIGKGGIILLN